MKISMPNVWGRLREKKDQFAFKAPQLWQRRATLNDEVKAVLSPKDSLFRIVARNTAITPVISMVDEVDTNRVMTFIDETPTSLLQYLDDSIDYLRYQHDEKKPVR